MLVSGAQRLMKKAFIETILLPINAHFDCVHIQILGWEGEMIRPVKFAAEKSIVAIASGKQNRNIVGSTMQSIVTAMVTPNPYQMPERPE